MSVSVSSSLLTRPLTWEDLEQFPDDGKRREVVGGKLYVSPAPLKHHQDASKSLFLLLFAVVEVTGWGKVYYAPVDVRFPNGDQVQPDLIVLRRERMGIYRRNTVHGAPDLVVEILSPSNRSYDVVEKAALYEVYGVPEYWIADPARREFRPFALVEGRYVPIVQEPDGTFRSRVVPDLVVDPVALWAALDE